MSNMTTTPNVYGRNAYGQAAGNGDMVTDTGKKVILPAVRGWDGRAIDLSQPIATLQDRVVRLKPEDAIIPINTFGYAFGTSDKLPGVLGMTKDVTGNGRDWLLSEHAVKQLCSYAKVPFQFFMRMPDGMKLNVLNHFVQDYAKAAKAEDKMMTFRTVENELAGRRQIRAVLTDRFTALDDLELVNAVVEVVGNRPVHVQEMNIGETSTHLRLIFPSDVTEVKKGDPVFTGLHVSNSEVGTRSVRVQSLVWELVCSNGMVGLGDGGSQYIMRHTGNADRLRAYVKQALDDAAGESKRMIAAFQESLSVKINDPAASLEALMAQEDMSRGQFDAMLAAWQESPSEDLFGIVRATTRAAQVMNNYDDRYEMERIGTKLLMKPTAAVLNAVAKPTAN